MKKLRKKMMSMLTVFVLIVFCLTGCGGGNTSSGSSSVSTGTAASGLNKAEDGKYSLSTSIMMDPEILDPAFNYNAGRFEILPNICEPILKLDSDGNLQNNICESWEAVDATTYVYQIRKDVKFSDGTDLTAEDVAFCLNRILDPATGSSVSWLMASVETIEQTGDYEVTVTLSKPDASWQYMPATCIGQVYSKAACEAAGESFGSEDAPPVGAGAYKLESWNRGTEVVLTENEYYWRGTDSIAASTITFKIYSDPNAMLVSAQNGELDIVSPDNDLALINEYSKITGMNVESVKCYTSMGVFFNTKRSPLDDINVRKALAYCLDEQSYSTAVYNEYGETGNGLMYGSGGYGSYADEWSGFVDGYAYKYSYDMEAAKECLAQSAYPDGGFELTIIVCSSMTSGLKMAQMLQASAKELGITVNIEKMTLTDYYSAIYGGTMDENGVDNYDMCIMGWGPDFPDPIGCIQPVFESATDCVGGANYSSLCSDEVDAAIMAQNEEIDPDARLQLLFELCDVLGEQCAYKMLAYPDNIYVVKNGIHVPWSAIPYWTFFVSDITVTE